MSDLALSLASAFIAILLRELLALYDRELRRQGRRPPRRRG